MTHKLLKLIKIIETAPRDEVKQAQKEVGDIYHQSRKRSDHKRFSVFVDALKNFDKIKDADHQAYFVNTLKWAVMAVGRKHFTEFSQFILKTIQHPSGNVRQASIHVASWLKIMASSINETKTAQNLTDQLCHFIFNIEELIDHYEEPRHRKYKYIQSMPPGVYKSLQKLITEELLRAPYYESLYEDYLKRRQSETTNNQVVYNESAILNLKNDVEYLTLKQFDIKQELDRLLNQTNSTYTSDDVLRAIYEEKRTNGDTLSETLNMFPLKEDADMHATIQVLQDAWNFFPHKSLNDKSPAETILAHHDSHSPPNPHIKAKP